MISWLTAKKFSEISQNFRKISWKSTNETSLFRISTSNRIFENITENFSTNDRKITNFQKKNDHRMTKIDQTWPKLIKKIEYDQKGSEIWWIFSKIREKSLGKSYWSTNEKQRIGMSDFASNSIVLSTGHSKLFAKKYFLINSRNIFRSLMSAIRLLHAASAFQTTHYRLVHAKLVRFLSKVCL